MFMIIGGDGKEYGPANVEQLRSWIAAGRVNLETQAKRGGTVEWRRLGDFPEFSPAGSEPPVIDGTDTPPGATAATPAPAFAAAASFPVTPSPVPASRWARLGAAAIDCGLGFLCALPGMMVMGDSFFTMIMRAGRGEPFEPDPAMAGRILAGCALLMCATLALGIVQIVMLSLRGQTIGKRLLGLRIIRYADNSPAGFAHAWLLRSLVPGIIGVVPYLGFLFTLVDICFIFGHERRCVHDYIAGTKVVKA